MDPIKPPGFLDLNSPPSFRRCKLNKCAHCDSRELTLVAGSDGHLYFICQPHWTLLALLVRNAAAKVGIRI